MIDHKKIETNATLLLVLSFLAVTVGGIARKPGVVEVRLPFGTRRMKIVKLQTLHDVVEEQA